VRWGRLYLDHSQPDIRRGPLQRSARIEEGPRRRPAGPGPGGRGRISRHGQPAWRTRRWKSDPKLLEAQELLARLALEDNDTAKATEEAKKALVLDAQSVGGRAILASIDWLADKKDTASTPNTARGYRNRAHFFVINRRYGKAFSNYRKAIALDPQLYSARSQLGINLMRLGQDAEAYTNSRLVTRTASRTLPRATR